MYVDLCVELLCADIVAEVVKVQFQLKNTVSIAFILSRYMNFDLK